MVLYITFMPSIWRILINNKIFKSFSRSVCFQVKLGCYPCEHAASFTDGPKGWEKRWGRWGVREVLIFEKCPDIQYTHFSYDEYGGFDVKIIAQNHTFFAHRWAQNHTFFAHRWAQIRPFLSIGEVHVIHNSKIIHNYVVEQKFDELQTCLQNDAKKFIIFLISISILIFYTYFLRLLLSAGSSFLKSVLLVRIVFTWLFFMFKVTECQFYIIWAVMLYI